MKLSSKVLFGSILTAGALGGSITAFAGTTTSPSSNGTSTTPGFHHAFGGHGWFNNLSTVATTLGIDQTTLKSDLQSGQSIADIAKSKGVSEQTVIDELQKSFQARLDEAVASGKMTSQQEQQNLTNIQSHVKQLVEQKGELNEGFAGREGFGGHGWFNNLGTVATTLGIDQTTLLSDLHSGQSIADIAKSKGVSEQTVIDALQKSFQTRLDEAAASGKMTSQQQQQKLTNLQTRVKQFVEQKGNCQGFGNDRGLGQGASSQNNTGTTN